ncbi:hypothetical protein F8O06_07040 [Pseudoclavibacter sp. CFCC 14310]|uniref:hypothetical protein n=1 Tax=Pseudoclavibacter sp. CFCC 14310 TaxID=2615180 RepID=UPI001300FE00|nr:hypothetical protein [Pseudoclavibacter sp. CFCC 14310]KAB1646483.1 hypothetical protein F8O06_07040 [Pseudoclavibacter sp. CFCC 14310]
MTSEPIEAYGGVSIPPDMLRELAKQIQGRDIPFHVDHKLSRPIRMRGFVAFVESRQDGIDELRFEAEIHEDDHHWLESRPGVSAMLTTPLARDESEERTGDAVIQLSADHAWFADDALIDAEEELAKIGIARDLIQVERAYQFSFVPDPQIYIDISYTILLSVGANGIWEGIKKLFSRRRTPRGGDALAVTAINLSVADGQRSFKAVVTTNDETVAQRALDSLDQAATTFFQDSPVIPTEENPKTVSIWDDDSGVWGPLD